MRENREVILVLRQLTADQQSQTKEDIEITRKIRKAVVNDESLAINVQNVKIITIDRVVTLKGPVESEEEKMAIEEKAAQIAGKENVKNQIDIAHKKNMQTKEWRGKDGF